MLEAWVDTFEDKNHFFSSLQKYLVSHAYSNAETRELWEALSTSNISVGRLMSTWTDQPGYPVVIVDGSKVTQERFYFSSNVDQKDLEKYAKASNCPLQVAKQSWVIPFAYSECIFKNGKIEKSDLKIKILDSPGSVDIPLMNSSFILGNFGRSGVYRVQYPLETYQMLSQALQDDFRAISPNDRAGLLNDVFTLSWSGRIDDVSVVLNLTRFLVNESDSIVWFTALSEMNAFESILALSESYGHFTQYYSKLLKKLHLNLGWVDRDEKSNLKHIRSLVRARVLSLAISFHDEDAVKYALGKFQILKAGNTDPEISLDNIGVIYEAAAIWGNDGD